MSKFKKIIPIFLSIIILCFAYREGQWPLFLITLGVIVLFALLLIFIEKHKERFAPTLSALLIFWGIANLLSYYDIISTEQNLVGFILSFKDFTNACLGGLTFFIIETFSEYLIKKITRNRV